MKVNYVAILVLAMLLVSIKTIANSEPSYKNLINRTGTPYYMQDFEQGGHQRFSPLFDLGAWHGHLLPDEDHAGGFSGPAIVTEEYLNFIAPYLEKLSVYKGDTINRANKVELTMQAYSLPGALVQELKGEGVTITLTLRFVSNRTSLVKTHINTQQPLTLYFEGELVNHLSAKNGKATDPRSPFKVHPTFLPK